MINKEWIEEARRCEQAWKKNGMYAILKGFPPPRIVPALIPKPRWNFWLERNRRRKYSPCL